MAYIHTHKIRLFKRMNICNYNEPRKCAVQPLKFYVDFTYSIPVPLQYLYNRDRLFEFLHHQNAGFFMFEYLSETHE